MRKKSTTKNFIEKANRIHNFKYDYSKSVYTGNQQKLEIICAKHGSFLQKPNDHLSHHGCPLCKREKRHLGLEPFVEKANKVHKNTYDYSSTIYINNYSKIKIICLTHGIFEQTPSNHLAGRGCPKCNESVGEKLIRSHLSTIEMQFESQCIVKHKNFYMKFDFKIDYEDKSKYIEYNGIQHYAPEGFGSKNPQLAEENFYKNLKNDKRKIQYCKDKNLDLLIIPYWDKENINQIIDGFLKGNNLVSKNFPEKIQPYQIERENFLYKDGE